MARVPLLEIRDLRVNFETHDSAGRPRIARALNGVTFDLARGEILGLVGETGAGKSLTASAILGLVRPPGRRESGRIVFDGQDLTELGEDELQMLRGARIALVVQSMGDFPLHIPAITMTAVILSAMLSGLGRKPGEGTTKRSRRKKATTAEPTAK